MLRLLLALSLAMTFSACSRARKPIEAPQPVGGSGGPAPAIGGGGNNNDGQTGSLPITLQEKDLQPYASNTSALTYDFAYGDAKQNGAIAFTNGRAQIMLNGLPVGKRADLRLDILESGVVKLHGEILGLVLNAGPNTQQIVLKPAGGGNGDGANVTIDITIDGANPSPTPTPVPTSGNGGGSNPTPNPTQTPTPPGPTATPQGGGNGGGGNNNPDPTPAPNGSSFARDVKPIFEKNCSECHHAGRPIDLMRFQDSVSNIDNILSQVASAMPPAPRDKLSSADVQKIKDWKAAGLKP